MADNQIHPEVQETAIPPLKTELDPLKDTENAKEPENKEENKEEPKNLSIGGVIGNLGNAFLGAVLKKDLEYPELFPPKYKNLSTPFYSNISSVDFLKISTNSWYELLKIKEPRDEAIKLFQIVKSEAKLERWRKGIDQSFHLHLRLKMMQTLLFQMNTNMTKYSELIEEAYKLLSYELQIKGFLEDLIVFHKNSDVECEKKLAELKHDLKNHSGLAQDAKIKSLIVWNEMIQSINQIRLEKHIPLMQLFYKQYLEEHEPKVGSLPRDKNSSYINIFNEVNQWITQAQTYQMKYGNLDHIVDLEDNALNDCDVFLKSGVDLFYKVKDLIIETFRLRRLLEIFRKIVNMLDEVISIQIARIPLLGILEKVEELNSRLSDTVKDRVNAYQGALIAQKSHYQMQLQQLQQQIINANVQKLYSHVKQLQRQVDQISTYMQGISSQIQSLPNQVVTGVSYTSYSWGGRYRATTFDGATTKSLGSLKSIVTPGEIKSKMNSMRIPDEAMEFIDKGRYELIDKAAKENLMILGGMVQDQVQKTKADLEEAKRRYAVTQAFMKEQYDLDSRLQFLNEYVDNMDTFISLIKNTDKYDEDQFSQQISSMVAFYYNVCGFNYTNLFPYANLYQFLKARTRPFGSCAGFCSKKGKPGYEIRFLTEKQLKVKLAKIIRKRLDVPNKMCLSCEERIAKSLSFADLLTLLKSKKVWGALVDGCESVRIEVFSNYSEATSQHVGKGAKVFNGNYNLNIKIKDFICYFASFIH